MRNEEKRKYESITLKINRIQEETYLKYESITLCMESTTINPKRIRESAPYRKSMSMNTEDMLKAQELERLFTSLYPSEAPFTFSKTISKALEIAYAEITSVQESSTETKQEAKNPEKSRVPKMFRNGRKH